MSTVGSFTKFALISSNDKSANFSRSSMSIFSLASVVRFNSCLLLLAVVFLKLFFLELIFLLLVSLVGVDS